ncbi:MAG: MFS transporter [Solirubrobacterales bacterium]|nr:MFS transporter [Solirubrobacterales bacterium]
MSPPVSRRAWWTLAVTGAALFMTALDNLVVGVALPSIRADLGGSIESLEWTVNAYTLAFAVLLLTGAALGDRFGRRRMFLAGVAIFTGASAIAALASSLDVLIAARAVQGLGAAIVTPLTLTLVSEAFPPQRRGAALGIWGGISGLGVALGPFVGGAVVEGVSWHWIFWLNVPFGLALLPLAARVLGESRGPDRELDLRGLADPAAGTTINCGVVRGGSATNVIAEHAMAEIDVRIPDLAEDARVRAAFAALRAQRPGAELAVEEIHSRPPLVRTPAIAAAAARARELGALLGLELAERSAGGVSDGNLAAAEGALVLDGLGPEGGGAHAVDEHVSLDSLVERTALIALLIAAL